MKVKLWGTRGSIPTALTWREIERKVRATLGAYREAGAPADLDAFLRSQPFADRSSYGGETCCVQVDTGGPDVLIIDAGSGLRVLGEELCRRADAPTTYHIFLSHFHWDHIQGLPFFKPCYSAGNVLHFYALHDHLETLLRAQQAPYYFPVDMDYMAADFRFHQIALSDTVTVNNCRISAFALQHPQNSYGFVIDDGAARCVYASDCEYIDMPAQQIDAFIKRYADADLLIFDAQYTLEEAMGSKHHWGHSTFGMGVDFARLSRIKRLCFYHHDPVSTDRRMDDLLAAALQYQALSFPKGQDCDITWGYDGQEFTL